MGTKQIKAGIIGCGHLGKIHCKLMNEISTENDKIKFNGIYDIIESKTEEAAELYKTKIYKSYEELLKDVDTLIIVTPTSTHFAIAKQGIERGINLFIEKPVTENTKQANELMEIAEKSNIKIQIGHVERFNPALLSIESYNINPMFIESHRLAQFNPRGTDVSVVQDLMIHDLDIVLSIVKSTVKEIHANGVTVISNNIDIANARIEFENGCIANLTSSRISLKKMRKMRIFQSNSYISIDFLNNKSEVFRLADSNQDTKNNLSYPIGDKKKIVFEQPEAAANLNPIKFELESFFDSILENKPVKVTLEDGIKAIEISDRIINEINKNKV